MITYLVKVGKAYSLRVFQNKDNKKYQLIKTNQFFKFLFQERRKVLKSLSRKSYELLLHAYAVNTTSQFRIRQVLPLAVKTQSSMKTGLDSLDNRYLNRHN